MKKKVEHFTDVRFPAEGFVKRDFRAYENQPGSNVQKRIIVETGKPVWTLLMSSESEANEKLNQGDGGLLGKKG